MWIFLIVLLLIILFLISGTLIVSGILSWLTGIGFLAALIIILIVKFIFDLDTMTVLKILLFFWLISFIIGLF